SEATSGALPHVPCESGQVASKSTKTDSGNVLDGSTVDASWGDPARGDGSEAGRAEAGMPNLALQCELWTSGPAHVHVTARGYAVVDEDLQSSLRSDNCGVSTVDVRVALSPLDGG